MGRDPAQRGALVRHRAHRDAHLGSVHQREKPRDDGRLRIDGNGLLDVLTASSMGSTGSVKQMIIDLVRNDAFRTHVGGTP